MLATFPAAGLDKPDYYATLRLDVKSTDGQPLGRSEELIVISNKLGREEPGLSTMGPISLSQVGPGKYAVTMNVGNTGQYLISIPAASGTIGSGNGVAYAQTIEVKRGGQGLILPLGSVLFSGAIDAGRLKPGPCAIDTR